jgi:hypothetical protein
MSCCRPITLNHDAPAASSGREGVKQIISMFGAAFPVQITIEDLVAEGDLNLRADDNARNTSGAFVWDSGNRQSGCGCWPDKWTGSKVGGLLKAGSRTTWQA